ncbi:hypothetical protein HK105_207715 [Polyrhizophydium stewartii]|uniref:Molybdate-anion transporter n=1 Tax=Polyrhizophydium stewartii TaxID=2732419 RepID=A0ABR4N029_9FUNG|nr:Molybdate-anion transporter [Polyrhizophydium stewartii]
MSGSAAASDGASPADSARAGRYQLALLLLIAACAAVSVRAQQRRPAAAAGKPADDQDDEAERGGVPAFAAPRAEWSLASLAALATPAGLRAALRAPRAPFPAFQLNYLAVYGLAFIADWLQGPYIYPLYKSYGYDLDDIALLFVAGFLSSAVFGTFVGSVADRFGRKLGSALYCILYALSCLTKLSPDFTILMIGRLLGGVSTSLLFSVFESWMVAEHRSRGFDESLLSETFAWSTFVNGFVAILSGVIANFVVDIWGLVSPFMVSVLFLMLSLAMIHSSWTENYGAKTAASASPSFMEVVAVIRRDARIFAVGTMQFCFESAMYTFVFLWSPVLEGVVGSGAILPFGVIFSSFMVCMMIGSTLFKMAIERGISHETIIKYTFALAAVALLVPALTKSEFVNNVAFNLFEMCCGLYYPAIGSIRSKVVPEETRSTVMNIFRVPLNLIVVVILLKVDSIAPPVLFVTCASLIGVACWFATAVERAAGGGGGSESMRGAYAPTGAADDGEFVGTAAAAKQGLASASASGVVSRAAAGAGLAQSSSASSSVTADELEMAQVGSRQ